MVRNFNIGKEVPLSRTVRLEELSLGCRAIINYDSVDRFKRLSFKEDEWGQSDVLLSQDDVRGVVLPDGIDSYCSSDDFYSLEETPSSDDIEGEILPEEPIDVYMKTLTFHKNIE